MLQLFRTALFLSTLCLVSGCDEPIQPTAAQTQASLAWLQLVDDGQYGRSWDKASSLFQKAVDRPVWTQKVQSVRGPLGDMVARHLESAQLIVDPAGQPDGEYLVLRYRSSFESKQRAIETHTLIFESSSELWLSAGYFVK